MKKIAGSIPAAALSSATLAKLFTHIASVTKRYEFYKLRSKQTHCVTHWHGLPASIITPG